MESCVWIPDVIDNVSQNEVDLYVKFACSACIPGGPCSQDKALNNLYLANGDIKLAMQRLLKPPKEETSINHNNHIDDNNNSNSKDINIMDIKPSLNTNASNNYNKNGSSHWTREEVSQFERLIAHHGKKFSQISSDLKIKSVTQCIEFYYLWKRSPLTLRKMDFHPPRLTIRKVDPFHPPPPSQPPSTTVRSNSNVKVEPGLPTTNTTEQQSHNRAALTGLDQFPCKVCGRVFEKIKSRSAHMKRHKNGR